MNYSFHPDAEKELEDIEAHYDGMREALGDRFRIEVEATIARILKFPTGWQPLSEVVRRCRLLSFPYSIIYRVKTDEIRILAIMHHRREPNYWTYRA
ncbi:MAG TPA: type II toxin-antitoxin system RelE/ParE family toxin [Pyrinomonadaceae bacterium]|nr:type II toxin-antitoxin system RelE/ParE family toxin [Pyrinomonadaceae bacterium]